MSAILPSSPRPVRTSSAGPVTRVLRGLGVLASLAITVWILVSYPGLPQTIPTHFAVSGTADAWGSKGSVLVLAAVMLLLSLALAALSTRPRIFNYPVVVTEHNAEAVYRDGERLMVWVLLALQGIYLGIASAVLLGGGGVVIGVSVALMVGAAIVVIVRLLRAAR